MSQQLTNHYRKVLWFFIFVITVSILVEPAGCTISVSACEDSRCNRRDAPVVRFPFWLNGSNHSHEYCKYHGFQLSCDEKGNTVLELPNSVKLFVKEINYEYPYIDVYDHHACPSNLVSNLNLSTTPFQPVYNNSFTLFNCSVENDYLNLSSERKVHCLSNIHGYTVYAPLLLWKLPLVSCRKMYKISSVFLDLIGENQVARLQWLNPDCYHCVSKRLGCRLSSNTSIQTECFKYPGFDTNLIAIGLIPVSALLLSIGYVLYSVYEHQKNKEETQVKLKKFLEDYKSLKPTRYTYSDLKRITNNFTQKLSKGGFSSVFKGTLSNDVLVAVKLVDDFIANGDDFINEMGSMARIHHVNIVRLVGFCADRCSAALVYEYLENESLEKFIFPRNRALSWEKLCDIALGIAKGMEYLHQGCELQILHFDIKPMNILLDANFTPKISGFGLAKLCPKGKSTVSMTAARGTLGYIAPEVLSRNFGNASYKSDVYSYGMLLLEMVGGRKNVDATVDNTSQVYFPEWVYNHLDNHKELGLEIEDETQEKIVMKLAIVGLWCIQWYPVHRPSMKDVIQMLEGDTTTLILPPSPFPSSDQRNMNAVTPRRPLNIELDVITELE